MAENEGAQGTQANAETTQAKPADQAAQGGAQGPNAEWQAKRLKKQNEDLKAKIAAMEETSKSAEQKAREDTERKIREEVEAHYKAQMTTDQIRSEIRLKLVEANIPANQVAVILEEAKPESVEEAVAAATAYAEKWTSEIAKPQTLPARPLGQPGVPSTGTPARDWAGADLRKASTKEMEANWPEIQAAIAKRLSG